jgi:undecaprenyl-diphosphatase
MSDACGAIQRSRPRRQAPTTGPARRFAAGRLADPDVHLGLGLLGIALSGLPVHDHSIGPREERIFRAVNTLPDRLMGPAWIVMQAGNFGAVPVAAALAWVSGRRPLAGRLAVAGTATWASAKVVKRVYRRPRPGSLLIGTRHRGAEATGLGYVSGHAGVAVALGVTAFPDLGPAGRAGVLAGIPVVALGRMYVGAHLPLDILGGAALGLAMAGLTGRLTGRCHRVDDELPGS